MDWGDLAGETLRDLRGRQGSEMQANDDCGLDLLPPHGAPPGPWPAAALPQETRPRSHSHWRVNAKGRDSRPVGAHDRQDILGKPKVNLDWHAAHAFCVDADRQITPDRLNLPLIDARP
jgi:hypothetical protein